MLALSLPPLGADVTFFSFGWQRHSSSAWSFLHPTSLCFFSPPAYLNLGRCSVFPSLARPLHLQPSPMEHSCPVSPVNPLQYARHIRADGQAGGHAGRQRVKQTSMQADKLAKLNQVGRVVSGATPNLDAIWQLAAPSSWGVDRRRSMCVPQEGVVNTWSTT